jgi:hypothetical protein
LVLGAKHCSLLRTKKFFLLSNDRLVTPFPKTPATGIGDTRNTNAPRFGIHQKLIEKKKKGSI